MGAWTDEDNRLKAFIAQGVSIVRVAAIFKRKMTNISQQARKIGRPFPLMKEVRKRWAKDDPTSSWRQW